MTEKNKKNSLIARVCGAVVVAAGGMFYLYQNQKPRPSEGMKSITVDVIHEDGSKKSFTYTTDEEYLGQFLAEQGLIQGDEGEYGLFVETVDGQTSQFDQDGSWWQLQKDGESAEVGADQLPIEDGSTYTWIYTK